MSNYAIYPWVSILTPTPDFVSSAVQAAATAVVEPNTAAMAVSPVHVCEANNPQMAHAVHFMETRSAAHGPEDLAVPAVAIVDLTRTTVALRVFRVLATAQVALMAAD